MHFPRDPGYWFYDAKDNVHISSFITFEIWSAILRDAMPRPTGVQMDWASSYMRGETTFVPYGMREQAKLWKKEYEARQAWRSAKIAHWTRGELDDKMVSALKYSSQTLALKPTAHTVVDCGGCAKCTLHRYMHNLAVVYAADPSNRKLKGTLEALAMYVVQNRDPLYQGREFYDLRTGELHPEAFTYSGKVSDLQLREFHSVSFGSSFDQLAFGFGLIVGMPQVASLRGVGAHVIKEAGIESVTMATGVPVDLAGVVRGKALKAVPDGDFYSVAYEMKLKPESYPGVTRYMHFKEANVSQENAMKSNPVLSDMGIDIPRSSAGSIIGRPPADWAWHHDAREGVMQLVPKSQHPRLRRKTHFTANLR